MFLELFEPTETRLVRELLAPGDTFVDVGAHIGWFTTLASKAVGTGRVVAIEPFAANAALLKMNIANNDCRNVELFETAVGSEAGTLALAGSDSGGVTALPWGRLKDRVEVPVRRLDDVVPTTTIKLMKIDVEGWEAHVLRGGSSTLANTDSVLIEVSSGSLHKAGSSPDEILSTLRQAGFNALLEVREGGVRQLLQHRVGNVLATRAAPTDVERSLGLSRRVARRLRPMNVSDDPSHESPDNDEH